VLGRAVLPSEEPMFAGTLAAEEGGRLEVELVDWKELVGIGVAACSVCETGETSSSFGEGPAAGGVWSLETSARGVRGGFVGGGRT